MNLKREKGRAHALVSWPGLVGSLAVKQLCSGLELDWTGLEWDRRWLGDAGAGPGSVLDQCRRVRRCGHLKGAIQGQTWPVVDSKSAIKLAGQGCPISRGLSPGVCGNSRVQVSDLAVGAPG